MAKPIKMPKLSDEMTEGKISEWQKKVGDEVSPGDVLALVETDKATLDVEAFDQGVLIAIAVNAGESAAVGLPIGWIGARGEKAPGAGAAAPGPEAPGAVVEPEGESARRPARAGTTATDGTTAAGEPPPSAAAPAGPTREQGPRPSPPSRGARQAPFRTIHRATAPAGRVPASPAARRRAREDGIDIGTVQGSGPRGRIVLADLERSAAGATPAGEQPAAPAVREVTAAPPAEAAARPAAHPAPEATAAPGSRAGIATTAPPRQAAPRPGRRRGDLPPRVELRDETIALSPMRRAIARNLAVSKPGAPHYYLEASADMRRMVALREQIEELGGEQPVSLNDLVVKATADALSRHPEVNASWGADAIVRRGSIDIGIAVALDDGLVTPVVREADRKSVLEIAREIRELAGRARERRLRPEEYQGASFTISNLGMYGIEAFYAVINPPEAAILAVGTVQKVPWVDEATGEIVAMERMRIGLSGDHRVVDGATGARFLGTLKAILESPLRLVLG